MSWRERRRYRAVSRKLIALAAVAEGEALLRDAYARQLVRALTQLYTWDPKQMTRDGATFELIYDLAGKPCGRRLAESLLVRAGAVENPRYPGVWRWPPVYDCKLPDGTLIEHKTKENRD